MILVSNYSLVPDTSRTAPIVDIWLPTAKPELVGMYASSWVPLSHRRRLASYKLLSAIYNNAHKCFLQRGEEILEYGDAALVVETLRDALIGSTGIKIIVDNIENDAIGKKKVDRLRKWWKDELMDTKLFENETNCSSLGDSVYRLRWSTKNPRKPTVKVDTFDPGFFFPDFDEDGDLEKVHLAWEEVVIDDAGNEVTYVYKETYELINGICHVTAGWYDPQRDDNVSDLEYSLNYLKLVKYKTDVDGNPYDRLSLQIDFIPIVYVPNISVQGEPFGKSDLSIVIDLLAEMANTNTDMAANTSILGSPPMVIQSENVVGADDGMGASQVATVGPGQTIEVGANGDAHLLDVSGMNTALDSYLKKLDQKLYENTRATKLAAGKMEGSAIPSGISLRLMQNPLVQKTLPKRILRSYKVGLMLKFVQKMFLAFGIPQDRECFTADEYDVIVEFGDIFPTDRSQAINDLAVAYAAGFMSLDVAVSMCQKYGVDIDSVKDEVEKIKKEREELNTYINVGSSGSSDGTQSGNMQTTSDGMSKSDNTQE